MNFSKIYIVILLILLIPIIGMFFYFFQEIIFKVEPESASLLTPKTHFINETILPSNINIDVEYPRPLVNPPEIIKAIYLTGWSAGAESRINYLIDLVKTTEINAVVIDVKDFSGYVSYDMAVPEVEKYKAEKRKIPNIDLLIKRLHENGIYVIARITVFQDPVLAQARPDLAIHSQPELLSSISTLFLSLLWLDNYGLSWVDPAAKEVWDYNIAISKDAIKHGFDELNFDYIRFPSDGDLQNMSFPFWNGTTPKHIIIKDFFKYLRQELPDIKISADLFGLSTVGMDDLGIGQIIENAYKYFDYVSPMVYPSHYSDGFLGFQNPAEHPYEVIKYSMETALKRLLVYEQLQESNNVKLRPWLQDFDLGADYDAEMVRSEIKAVYDATGDRFSGFMLWNPSNFYTKEAFKTVEQNP